MTALAAVGSAVDRQQLNQSCAALLSRMSHRGAERRDQRQGERYALGVARFGWECEVGQQGPAMVAQQDDDLAVADGTLYYLADLRRALDTRGGRSDCSHTAEWVLAAYRAFGDACLDVLEGDFAFVIWEGRRRRLVLGRDHSGRRPLHYWATNQHILVGSTARAVAAHPEVRAAIDDRTVVAALGALLGGSLETGFIDVRPVPASTLLAWEPFRGVREVGRWTPPHFVSGGVPKAVEGGLELRRLLGVAAAERCRESDTVAIWLSGGADSPAVLGSLSCTDVWASKRVSPITISYPVGDLAREDEFVQAICDKLGLQPTWQDSEAVDLFGDWKRFAAERDDPYAHTFEAVNRRLAQGARDAGARVVLDGHGGDQLFDVPDVFLADLLVHGQWRELLAARRAKGLSGLRSLVRTSVLPLLPDRWRYALGRARGYTPEQIRWQALPRWLAAPWREHPDVELRYEREPRRRLLESPAAYVSRWYVEAPYFPRAVSWATTSALCEGIDLRSPLYDRRVLCFAASRPLGERGTTGPSKPLLREAMRGVLPEAFLAPRALKTGIPSDFLRRKVQTALPNVASQAGDVRSWRLTQRGLVDPQRVALALNGVHEQRDHQSLVQLFLTIQAEFWIRSVTEA